MSKTYTFVLAGFGGQGVLFMGKVLAYSGMIENKQVSWLPSYGPAMRGGTANCSVTISDEEIGSPLVINPECLLVLNQPSFNSFIDTVAAGGIAIIDSSLVLTKTNRTDITPFYIPATKIAQDNNLKGLSNMIVLGKTLKEYGFTNFEVLQQALKKSIPVKKADMYDNNVKALKLGFDFV
ncbi:MAG: 2-oxoacid:acceptor oxidoreductase family protein [Clostridia bacterium]